jgi:hypothetical protein
MGGNWNKKKDATFAQPPTSASSSVLRIANRSSSSKAMRRCIPRNARWMHTAASRPLSSDAGVSIVGGVLWGCFWQKTNNKNTFFTRLQGGKPPKKQN